MTSEDFSCFLKIFSLHLFFTILLEQNVIKCICVGSWTCPTDEEQYKCHVLPVRLASMMPIKQYLVQLREDTGLWRTVATRSLVQENKEAEMQLTSSIIQEARTAAEASCGESEDWDRGGVPGDHSQHPRQGELPQRHQPHLPGGR